MTPAPPTQTATVRPARPSDVRHIRALVEPYAQRRILVEKEAVAYYESVQEFVVADVATPSGRKVVGCGAVHVL